MRAESRVNSEYYPALLAGNFDVNALAVAKLDATGTLISGKPAPSENV